MKLLSKIKLTSSIIDGVLIVLGRMRLFIVYDIARNPFLNHLRVLSPKLLLKFDKFQLKTIGRACLKVFCKSTHQLKMMAIEFYVYLIFTYDIFKDLHTSRIRDLLNKIATLDLNIVFSDAVLTFDDPYYSCGQPHRITRLSLFISHRLDIKKLVSYRSLMIKDIVST